MALRFERERIIVAPSRGKADAAKRYEFALYDELRPEAESANVQLTTGLDVTFLCARNFTERSLLALYFTGNPVEPQFVVAEFDFDDVHVSHTHDHGRDLPAAFKDFQFRNPGEPTAVPPVAKADG